MTTIWQHAAASASTASSDIKYGEVDAELEARRARGAPLQEAGPGREDPGGAPNYDHCAGGLLRAGRPAAKAASLDAAQARAPGMLDPRVPGLVRLRLPAGGPPGLRGLSCLGRPVPFTVLP